jgi:predicted nucleic acid-binding protein
MEFFDTNVLVYCHDPRDARKQQRAETLLAESMAASRLVLSTQVLLEFYNIVVAKRLRSAADAESLCRLWADYEVVPATPGLLFRAFALQQQKQISVWDALIVQAALDAGCKTLYTEDLQHGLRLGELAIVNPFASAPAVHEPAAPYAAKAVGRRRTRA